MGTPLYNTDIIPLTSRPTLTVMDDGDFFVILDTSTGKISKILKTNIMTALKITYDNTTSGLTADTVQAALDELVVNLGSTNTVIESLKGVGWTDENLVDHEERLDTLEGIGEGSVAKAIADAVSPLAEVVDTNRLYSDSQYLALKAKADSLQVKCNTLQAEVYTDDPILQYGAVEIIGKGYEADNTPIDVSSNVVDGSLELEQKGLTITNLVDGADIVDSGTVSFNTVNGDKYFDTLNETIITGDGTEMSATNSSGATANMAIYHLNALGLSTITDTDILTKLLPYVDGMKNVGKMGMRVVGKNLFDNFENVSFGYVSANTRNYPLDAWLLNTAPSITLVDKTIVFTGTSVNLIGTRRVLVPNKVYTVSIATTGAESGLTLYVNGVSKGNMVRTNNVFSISFTPTTSDTDIMIRVSSSSAGTKSYMLPMLNLGSSALPYAPYQEQLTFLPAIGNSLPNGVADSIKTVSDGWEHSNRVSTPASVGSGVAVNTTNYPTAKNAGQWVNELTAGGTEIGVIGTDSTTGIGTLRFELATPITTHYDLQHLTSGKTIHRFAGEEKIALYGTGLTFTENVLSVLSAVKFVAGVMTDITSLATITTNTVTFSGVNVTDVVYVKVEHDVDRPLGILEHTPAVSNTASRLASLEARVTALEV